MKKNKTKENILSVITLCGIFGLFAYFQFAESPIKNDTSKSPNIAEVQDEAKDATTITNEVYDFEVVEVKGEETPDVITISLTDTNKPSSDEKLNTKLNQIEPSEYQLSKAKMYIDRSWASDDNCKQEWIDYLRNNPDALDKYTEPNNPTANDEKKEVELTKVSSSD